MANQDEKIIKKISQSLEMKENEIHHSSNIRNTEGWDSFNHVNLIVMLEKEFNIQIDSDTIDKSTSVEGIIKLIKNAK